MVGTTIKFRDKNLNKLELTNDMYIFEDYVKDIGLVEITGFKTVYKFLKALEEIGPVGFIVSIKRIIINKKNKILGLNDSLSDYFIVKKIKHKRKWFFVFAKEQYKEKILNKLSEWGLL